MEYIRAIDPQDEWKRGIAFFLRIRGIFICSGTDIGLTVAAHFFLGWQTALMVLSIGIVAIAALFVFRKVRVRDLQLGVRMHALFHFLRDEMETVVAPFSGETSEIAMLKYRERFRHVHNDVAELIASFFRRLLRDDTVNCAIRLADATSGKREYVTWGRSKNMDQTREERSKPVPSEGSIAAALMRQEERGVYYIPNVRQVSEEDKKDKWRHDPNCELPDVTAAMVAPINAWDLGKKYMLGLLYVTSAKNKMSHLSVEPLKAIADVLGCVYPRITLGENGKGATDVRSGTDDTKAGC